MSNSIKPKLIHVGFKNGTEKLFLRFNGDHYFWETQDGTLTSITAPTIEEAMRLAHREWDADHFRSLICGFKYDAVERDEHGINALFHEMIASYSTATGVYFDESEGHLCKVDRASRQALDLWKELENEGKL